MKCRTPMFSKKFMTWVKRTRGLTYSTRALVRLHGRNLLEKTLRLCEPCFVQPVYALYMKDSQMFVTALVGGKILSTKKKALHETRVANTQSANNNIVKAFSVLYTFPFPCRWHDNMQLILSLTIPFVLPFIITQLFRTTLKFAKSKLNMSTLLLEHVLLAWSAWLSLGIPVWPGTQRNTSSCKSFLLAANPSFNSTVTK